MYVLKPALTSLKKSTTSAVPILDFTLPLLLGWLAITSTIIHFSLGRICRRTLEVPVAEPFQTRRLQPFTPEAPRNNETPERSDTYCFSCVTTDRCIDVQDTAVHAASPKNYHRGFQHPHSRLVAECERPWSIVSNTHGYSE